MLLRGDTEIHGTARLWALRSACRTYAAVSAEVSAVYGSGPMAARA